MESITAVLLDIEGTTTPIDFVYNILFPYAREHMRPYLAEHLASIDVQSAVRDLLRENAEDARQGFDSPRLAEDAEIASLDDLVAYLHWLMDQDRKSTPLKTLQGKIWEDGYRKGILRSQIFEDVPQALRRWHEQGKEIHIYSSGSVLAQKLLFAYSEAGDLTALIDGYFDTNIGAKTNADSYRRITTALEREPAEIMFLSDRITELDAAADAGLAAVLCVRPGNDPQITPVTHRVIHTFDQTL